MLHVFFITDNFLSSIKMKLHVLKIGNVKSFEKITVSFIEKETFN